MTENILVFVVFLSVGALVTSLTIYLLVERAIRHSEWKRMRKELWEAFRKEE